MLTSELRKRYGKENVEVGTLFNGPHIEVDFDNGYRASIVQHFFSYGGDAGLWELAVKRGDTIVYDTPITDDVIGHLTDSEVISTCERIVEL